MPGFSFILRFLTVITSAYSTMHKLSGARNFSDSPKKPLERAEPQEQGRYRIDHYGKSRNFTAHEGQTIIAVTLYRKGAAEILARLEEKDRRIVALESQFTIMSSESQGFPVPSSTEPVQAPPWTPPRALGAGRAGA